MARRTRGVERLAAGCAGVEVMGVQKAAACVGVTLTV